MRTATCGWHCRRPRTCGQPRGSSMPRARRRAARTANVRPGEARERCGARRTADSRTAEPATSARTASSQYAQERCALSRLFLRPQCVSSVALQLGHRRRRFSRRLSFQTPLMWSRTSPIRAPRHSSPWPHISHRGCLRPSASRRRLRCRRGYVDSSTRTSASGFASRHGRTLRQGSKWSVEMPQSARYFFSVAWFPPADRSPSRTSASEYE
jgi:hypothetical protein